MNRLLNDSNCGVITDLDESPGFGRTSRYMKAKVGVSTLDSDTLMAIRSEWNSKEMEYERDGEKHTKSYIRDQIAAELGVSKYAVKKAMLGIVESKNMYGVDKLAFLNDLKNTNKSMTDLSIKYGKSKTFLYEVKSELENRGYDVEREVRMKTRGKGKSLDKVVELKRKESLEERTPSIDNSVDSSIVNSSTHFDSEETIAPQVKLVADTSNNPNIITAPPVIPREGFDHGRFSNENLSYLQEVKRKRKKMRSFVKKIGAAAVVLVLGFGIMKGIYTNDEFNQKTLAERVEGKLHNQRTIQNYSPTPNVMNGDIQLSQHDSNKLLARDENYSRLFGN